MSKKSAKPETLADDVRDFLNDLPDITGIVHIGAGSGEETPFYIYLNVPVIYFEPIKSLYDILEERTQGTLIKPVNLAIGDCRKTVSFWESDKGGVSSSILEPSLHKEYFPERKFDLTECQQISLDEYMSDVDHHHNVLILDVQGYEDRVLRGAPKTLRTFKYCIIEVWKEPLYRDQPLKKDIDEIMAKSGFKEVRCKWTKYAGNCLYKYDI